ncbi:SigE family RNA polymerase sigma factor [Actinomadura craniellae]|uniref:SigE family RNA polymerase sigma factor n=1 Tax=Actinomadura craniellae TaxID=2231787 RepID=A0A365HGG8_9ACTN|nr:SigE family RNA polymerase sigma factor [Actinomadura craniellae]RAY17153.1 SigE family RNA polymerase sigma factor [Actinomadura craniellae]
MNADPATFTAFVEERGAGLLRFAVALTGDHDLAEDLLQGALERVYRKWDRIARRGDPESYVRRALVNATRDSWRQRQRRPERIGLRDEEGGSYAPWDEMLTRKAVGGVVERLPHRQRTVIVLRYWADLTEAETAKLMGVSVGTVKSQAHRALKALREQLSLDDQANEPVRGAGR